MNLPKITKTLFSGIQPTGIPHIGNLFGAISFWKKLQDNLQADEKFLISIVDLHAITTSQDPKTLLECSRNLVIQLISCGIDYKKCILFKQSHVL